MQTIIAGQLLTPVQIIRFKRPLTQTLLLILFA